MSVFTIADLHLSSDGEKAMDVFGSRWADYQNKIVERWNAVVTDRDTVIIPGDISWALRLEDSLSDFKLLESLPGKKLIGKGNHDFWWATASKMEAFFAQNNIQSVKILYNNAYKVENYIVCGTRGWFIEENQQKAVGTVDYAKIVNRELVRLKMSLDSAKKIQMEDGNQNLPILVFLHFPPVFADFICREFVDLLNQYDIKDCYYGHIHGAYFTPASRTYQGIRFRLIAADYLNFTPLLV